LINDIKIFGDFFNTLDTADIEKLLKKTPHEENKVREKLENIDFNKYFHAVDREEFIAGMF
jgi:hypothetical protein